MTTMTSSPAAPSTSASELLGRRVIARVVDLVPLVLLFVLSFFPSLDQLEKNHACQSFSNAQSAQNPDCNIVRMELGVDANGEPTPVFTLRNGRTIDADHQTLELLGTTYIVDPAPAASYVLPLAYALVVFVVIQGRWGWTPGKLLTGLRLAGPDLRATGAVKAFARWAVLDGLIGTVGVIVGLSGGRWAIVALSVLIGLPILRFVVSLARPNLAGLSDNQLGTAVVASRDFLAGRVPAVDGGPQAGAWADEGAVSGPEGGPTEGSPWLSPTGAVPDATSGPIALGPVASFDTAGLDPQASAAGPYAPAFEDAGPLAGPRSAGRADEASPTALAGQGAVPPSEDAAGPVGPSAHTGPSGAPAFPPPPDVDAPLTRPTDLSGQKLATGAPLLPSAAEFEAVSAPPADAAGGSEGRDDYQAPHLGDEPDLDVAPTAVPPGPGSEPSVDDESHASDDGDLLDEDIADTSTSEEPALEGDRTDATGAEHADVSDAAALGSDAPESEKSQNDAPETVQPGPDAEPEDADADTDTETAIAEGDQDEDTDRDTGEGEGEGVTAGEHEGSASPSAREPLTLGAGLGEPHGGGRIDLVAAATEAGVVPAEGAATSVAASATTGPEQQAGATQTAVAASAFQPTWDEARRAYICWDPSRYEWRQWDADAASWGPITQ